MRELTQDVKPEYISKTNLDFATNFKCYEKELEDFLKEDALNNQKIGISKPYLFFNNNILVGYITLLCDTLRLEGELRDFFKSKDVNYKSLPAIKIGRLAIDNNYQKQGFGTEILGFTMNIALKISKEFAGCRFLIVDAKRNYNAKKDSIHFYKKFGFKILKQREKGTIPMYLDIYL